MQKKNIAELFDEAAESYDSTRKKYIPCISDLYGVLVEQIPYGFDDEFDVLDLGAGTGLLTSMVKKAFPNASFTLVDISAEMLDKAKERFSDESGMAYICMDYASSELPGSYDAVVSALALHHSPLEELKHVFSRIHASLNDGGTFINADQILGRTPKIEASYEETWLKHAKQSGCTDEEIAIAIERIKADRTSTLSDQLSALESTGFSDANCWYQYYRYATYSSTKA